DKNDHFHDIPFNRERVSGRVSATASIRPFPKQNFRIILQPAYQLADIEGVYDVQPYFSLDATLRWTDKSGKFTASLAGSNLTNNPFHAKDTWKGQNFTMRYFRDWANVTLSLIYKFGNYKEKDHKQVDTSRMGQ
ncbi:MAG: TonB-dependent receptor, partial [Bacteroidaceae bacterium]|nr:TonB-dependent receptor [Bacteroidaceae bacterium]